MLVNARLSGVQSFIAGRILGMRRYKTIVTDYEGMQGCLDNHAEQGWLLFSVTPDTWRRTVSETSGMDQSPFEELDTNSRAMREYSASYYLLVFQSEEGREANEGYATLQEPLPMSASLPGFEG
jgi:hypothetical protein